MSGGRHDPPRVSGSETDSRSRDKSRGLASTCLGGSIAVLIAGGWASPTFVLAAVVLVGAGLGALLSVVVGWRDMRGVRPSMDTAPPRFHRLAAAIALGVAATVLLCWGLVLEAVLPGYGAALSAGLLSYAFLASTVPPR